MNTALGLLSHRLAVVVDKVRVQAADLTATIGSRRVTADSPRFLIAALASALYQVVHVGRPEVEGPREAHGRDRNFEARLAEAVPHEHTRYRARTLHHDEAESLVELSGVRVRVGPDRIIAGADGVPSAADEVRIAAARPALSPGFFLVDGSTPLRPGDPVLRVYSHALSADSAAAAWRTTLQVLEGLRVPYRAKVASTPGALPRRDAIVVYLGSRDRHVVPSLVAAAADVPGLSFDNSPFTLPVGHGLAVAWEPDDPRPGMPDTSLGEHRSRALATGLVRHATGQGPGSLTEVVRDALLEAGIDPLNPARNVGSPDFSGSL